MDRRSSTARTPNRKQRSFGTKLSANSPLPSSSSKQSALSVTKSAQKSSTQKSLSKSLLLQQRSDKKKTKQSTSIQQQQQAKSGSNLSKTTAHNTALEHKIANDRSSLITTTTLSTPGSASVAAATTTTPKSADSSIQKGKNLIDNFNSPSIVNQRESKPHQYKSSISSSPSATSSSRQQREVDNKSSTTSKTLAYSTINATGSNNNINGTYYGKNNTRTSSSNFRGRTMRNVRTGKRVATALNDEIMEKKNDENGNGQLYTWVETPTQVEIGRRTNSSGRDEKDKENDDKKIGVGYIPKIKEELLFSPSNIRMDTTAKADIFSPINWSTQAEMFTPSSRFSPSISNAANKLASIDEVATTITLSPGTTASLALTPSTLGTHTSSPSFMFSPSNVKKMSRVAGHDAPHSPLSLSTPTASTMMLSPQQLSLKSSSGREVTFLGQDTVKKSNVIHKKLNNDTIIGSIQQSNIFSPKSHSSSSPSSSSSSLAVERIGKVLIGSETLGSNFEHSLRLKKSVLTELKNVHHELERLRTINAKQDETIQALEEKEMHHKESLQAVRKLSLNTKEHLSNEVDSLRSERYVIMKNMVDVQGKLDDANAHVQQLIIHVQELEDLVSESKKREYTSNEQIKELEKELSKKQTLLEEQMNICELQLEDISRVESLLKGMKCDTNVLEDKLSSLTIDLAKAKEDAALSLQTLEEERMRFNERDVTRDEYVRTLEGRLKEVELRESDEIARLKEQIVNLEVERDEARTILEKERFTISEVTAGLAKAKEASEEQRLSFEQRDFSRVQQLETLAKSLTMEEQRSREHTSLVARLDEHIATVEIYRDDVRSDLEKERARRFDVESENDDLMSKLNEATMTIARLEMENKESVAKSDRLEESIVKLQTNLDASNSLNSNLVCQIDEVTAKFNHVTVEKNDAEIKLRETSSEVDRIITKISNEVDVLKSEIVSSNDQVAQLKVEVSKVSLERDEFVTRAKEAEAALIKSKEAADAERARFNERDSSSAEQVRDLKKRLVAEEQKTIESSRDHVMVFAKLEERIATIESDRDDVRNQLKQEQESSQEKQDKANAHIQMLQVKLDKSQRDASTSDAVCNNLRKDVKSLQDSKSHLNEMVSSLKGRIEVFDSEVESNQVTIAKLSASNESLETERSQLIGQLQMLELQVSEGNVDSQYLSSALKEARDELSINKTNQHQLECQIDDLKKIVALGGVNEANLMAKLSELSKQLVDSQTATGQSKALCSDLKSKLDTAEALLDESDAEIQSLSHDCDCLEKQVNDLNVLLENTEGVVSLLKDENQSLTIELSTVTSENESMKTKMKAESDSLNERIRVLTHDSKASQIEHDAAMADLSTKLDKSQRDTSQNKALAADLKSKLESIETLFEKTRAENIALENNCGRFEKQAHDLHMLLENADDELLKKRNEVKSLTVELESMTASRDALRSENESMALDLKSKEFEIQSLDDKVSELMNQVELMNESHALIQFKHNVEAGELLGKVDTSQIDANQSKALVTELKSKLESVESSLDEANANNRSLSDACEGLKRQHIELTSSLENTNEVLSQQKGRNQSLEAELASLSSSRDNICQEKDSLARELKSSIAEVHSLNDKVQVLTKQIRLCDADKSELSSKVSSMEIDLVKLNSQLKSQQLSLETKESENSSLQSQLRESKTNFDDLTSSMRQAEAQSKSQIKSYEVRLKELLSHKNDLEVTVKKLTNQVELIEAQSRRETLSHEVNQRQLMNDIRDLQNSVSGAKIKSSHLTKELKSKESELELAIKEAEHQEQEFLSKEKEICSLKSELMSYKETTSTLKSEGETSKSALETELNDARQLFTAEKESLTGRIQQLEMDLKQTREALSQQKQHGIEKDAKHLSAMELLNAKVSKANQLEMNHREEAKKMEQLLKNRQDQIVSLTNDLDSAKDRHLQSKVDMENQMEKVKSEHNDERNKLQESLTCVCKQEVTDLRQMLGEGVALNASLSKKSKENERVLNDKSAEIKQLKATCIALEQSMSQAESTFVREKQHLKKEIDEKQAMVESENDALSSEVEEAKQTEMFLRSKLQDTHLELVQLSMDLTCTREDVVGSISQAKNTAEEAIRHIVNRCEAEKAELQCEIKLLTSELLEKQDQFCKEISMKDREIEESAVLHKSDMQSFETKMRDIEQANSNLSVQNKEMRNLMQQQENTISQMNQKHDYEMNQLQEQCDDTRILNKNLAARLEVASSLDRRDEKLDQMMDTVRKMDQVCSEYCTDDSLKEAEWEDMCSKLQSRDETIERLTEDISVAQDKITSLMAEVERSNKERASFQSDWNSFQIALHKLVTCVQHDGTELPMEALPEMTSLLDTLFDLFQAKVDQVSSLQSKIRDLKTLQATRASEYEQLIEEINSVQERLSPLLSSHTESSNRPDDFKAILNTIEHELRDMCIQLDARIDQDTLSISQTEVIYGMLQSLKMAVTSPSDEKMDLSNDSGAEQRLVSDLLSEIEEAKLRVVNMGHKLDRETSYRKKHEMQCESKDHALNEAEDKIKSLEQRMRNDGERLLIQSQQIKSLEKNVQDSNESAKQAKHLQLKTQVNYEQAQTEIDSCQTLISELKTIVIEKNSEIQSKEGEVLDLKCKIDNLQAKVDGWSALEGLVTDKDIGGVSSPDDVVDLVAASTKQREILSTKVVELEEQCLRMNEDLRHQSLMHKAIVDGLESQCGLLSEERGDILDELNEKKDYIITLREEKRGLEASVDTLKKEKEEACHKLFELQKSQEIARQQQLDLESMNDELASRLQQAECLQKAIEVGVKELAGAAIIHATKLEGFAGNITLSSASSSESLEYISQFIDHASKMNQKYFQAAAGAVTPKASGSYDSFAVMDFASQHSEMLEDLKSMKVAIANVMSSPKLTPLKLKRQAVVQRIDEYDGDVYSDLLRAHEQLESLSSKIEAFQEDQKQWEERELYFQSRILELEQENELMKTSPPRHVSLEADKQMKSAGAVIINNFEQRYQRATVHRAFETWKSHTRTSKHMKIAKEMAKELAQTRKKVLLLKSYLDEN